MMWFFTCWARCIKAQINKRHPLCQEEFVIQFYVSQMKKKRQNGARRKDFTTPDLLEPFMFLVISPTYCLILLPGYFSHLVFDAVMWQRKID